MDLETNLVHIPDTKNDNPTRAELLSSTAQNFMPAAEAFAQEIYSHPAAAAEDAAKTLVKSAAMGAVVGYLVPARGPAAMLVAAGFTIPMAISAYKKFEDGYQETQQGKSLDQVSQNLAQDAVKGSYDLALGMAGGVGGTEFGVRLATTDSLLSAPGQAMQRLVMKGENATLSALRGQSTANDSVAGALGEATLGKITTLSGKSLDTISPADTSAGTTGSQPTDIVNTALDQQLMGRPVERTVTPFVEKTGLAARLEQHGIANFKLARNLDGSDGNKMYFGSLHGHSHYSDGKGDPKDLFLLAAKEGQDVTTITDHNHLAARGGVAPTDPRAKDEAGIPIIAANPIEYAQTFADAKATTNATHLSLVGTEIGTIGKVGGGSGGEGGGHGGSAGGDTGGDTSGGHGGGKGGGKGGHEPGRGRPHEADDTADGGAPDGNTAELPFTGAGAAHDQELDLGVEHDHEHGDGHHTHGMMAPERLGLTNPGGKPFNLAEARAESNAAAHIGGVNHIGLLEVSTFFETVRQPAQGMGAAIMRAIGKEPEPVVTAPDVVKINDGDYLALVNHLDKMKATDGGSPIITLNHPRYLADENPNTPADQRGRDYGQKSFPNQQAWLDRFATPYVRQVELIKGGALNPNPVDTVPTGMLDPTSFAGYVDKGVHASPAFGRDFHFGDPVGNPGATGIYAKGLDKPSILNALRQRRTIATTSKVNLSGVLTGNDDIMMGSILDHSTTPSLALKMRIDGNVHPSASYTVKLWGDTNIGDGKLAEVVQQKEVKGSDLLSSNQTVSFDPVKGTVGQNSAYYVEVNRKDTGSDYVDKMWTAPIWLENLAGTEHSLAHKLMAGQLGQYMPNPYNLPNPFQSKIGLTK